MKSNEIIAQLESLEIRKMVAETPYSFIQKHSENKGNPVIIERYHEDEYIYIYPNNTGDGLIFRDRAMRQQYDRYIKSLVNLKDNSYENINFDSFSIDLNSVLAYPGVYVFVYDESVPLHMRTLAPALIEDPMGANTFNIEDLDDGLKRLGTTYVFYNKSEEYADYDGSISSLNQEGVGDILIPNGTQLNGFFDLLGIAYGIYSQTEALVELIYEQLEAALAHIEQQFDAGIAEAQARIDEVTAEIASYNSQIKSLQNQAQALAEAYPYVLTSGSGEGAYLISIRRAKRDEYNELIDQINSLKALRESAIKSKETMTESLAGLSSQKDQAIATIRESQGTSEDTVEQVRNTLNEYIYAPRSFRITVPLKARNHTITKVVIYDHTKKIQLASKSGDTVNNGVSLYRATIFEDENNEIPFFHGTGNNELIQRYWVMNYDSHVISSDPDYVTYYAVAGVGGSRTQITRAEYETRIESVGVLTKLKQLEEKYEIVITPPSRSILSSGQPSYDFSLIHSTLNTVDLKESIDSNKIYANPSLAIDFGEAVGEERLLSKTSSANQVLIQGTYRAVTSFKIIDQGKNSSYNVTWTDSSGNKLDFSRDYASKKNAPSLIRDSLCGKYSALEFSPQSIALKTQSFVPEYSFDNGFSIFFVVKQNEERCSDDTRLHALYPTDKYKNGLLEIDWPQSTADSSDIELYKEEYALNYLYYKSNLMFLDSPSSSIVRLVDTKGIDRDSSHEITTPISAVSAGESAVSGFSKANFFESDAYAIVEVEYNGANSFKWYKNGVLQHSSTAGASVYQKSSERTLFLGGLKNGSDYIKTLQDREGLRETLFKIRKVINLYNNNKRKIDIEIADLEASIVGASTDEVVIIRRNIAALEESKGNLKTDYEAKLSVLKDKFVSDVNASTSLGFAGELSEIVIYSKAVSEDIRLRTEGYLAHKFCLDDLLPKDHVYKDYPPEEKEVDEEDVAEEGEPEVTIKSDPDPTSLNFDNYYVYSTQEVKGEWKPFWLPADRLAVSSSPSSISKASWNRTDNILTLHRIGADDITVNIDIFDTFETEIFPITGELVPQFSSFIDAIFPYPTASDDEQFQLSPAQKEFYDVLKFHSRAFPDLLWEKNAGGDTEVGGLYNSDTLDNSNFLDNVNERRRSSYVWSGIVNKVGGSQSQIRGTKNYYTSNYTVANPYTPAASPIMVETSMDFNNGYKPLFLETLNMDCLFTVSRGWSDADFSGSIENFDAVGVRLVSADGSLYNLAFLISDENADESYYRSLINQDFAGAKIFKGFNPLEVRSISIDISNSSNQFIEIGSGEQYSLEFIVYLGKDGTAKLDNSSRPIQSGWFVSNVSFVASDQQI
jgi:hypothetical protein